MTPDCLFVSDLHGRPAHWLALCEQIDHGRPPAVFVGGDLLPRLAADRFIEDTLVASLRALRRRLRAAYPRIFLLLGNDDPRAEEPSIVDAGRGGLWEYVHGRRVAWESWSVFGYAYVPPTPFHLKDWERYDVSRYVDPGCIPPEEGRHTVPVDPREVRYATIAKDLDALAPAGPLTRTIWLFHAPPYQTALDRAALDGKSVDHVPLDVHVGSIAIRRFIETRRPAVTLHGHIHESARLTGEWRESIGETVALSAAHDGGELALVRFDPASPADAVRELIRV